MLSFVTTMISLVVFCIGLFAACGTIVVGCFVCFNLLMKFVDKVLGG